MARAFDSIKDINDRKELWKLAVKVDSLWTVKRGKDDQIEFIIRDIKGDTIHVTITPDEVKKRQGDIEELKKLKTQILQNFRVQKYDAKFKWTEHGYKLIFVAGTKVYPNDNIPGMDVCGFKFKPLDEIIALKFREDLLVDVIGVVHELGSAQTTFGGKLKFAFTIKDLSSNVVDCCLWDNLASQFVDYLNTQNEDGPIVVIIKHARLKHATDNYPLQITNAWIGTFLLLNDDIPAINDFKKKLPSDINFATPTNMIQASSLKFSQSSASGSCRTPQDKFIMGHSVMKIKDIIKLPKDKICCTVGTTSHVRASPHGWCFPGCKDCIKQCSGDAAPFKCRDGHYTDVPIIRYKVDVQVFDGDDSGKFVFWDNTCIDLLGITSSELKQKMIKDGVSDPDEYPQTLDEMMGRKFAFRVNWQSEWKQCSVLACLDSKSMVDTLEAELGYLQVNPPNDVALAINASEDTIDEIQSLPIADNLLLSASEINEDVSGSSEHDPETSSVTPIKRSAKLPIPEPKEETIAAQLSTTKLKKRIKKEK